MPRSVKVSALLAIGLSILFFLFFEICKHAPVFSQVNVFTEDPYDSVGSFGIQLAPFMAFARSTPSFSPIPF